MATNTPINNRDDDVVRRKIWTAIGVTAVAAGLTGAGIRHVLDDDQANLGSISGLPADEGADRAGNQGNNVVTPPVDEERPLDRPMTTVPDEP